MVMILYQIAKQKNNRLKLPQMSNFQKHGGRKRASPSQSQGFESLSHQFHRERKWQKQRYLYDFYVRYLSRKTTVLSCLRCPIFRSTVVGNVPHHPKVKGLSPSPVNFIGRENGKNKDIFMIFICQITKQKNNCHRCPIFRSTMVGNLPRHPKVMGLSPSPVNFTGRENGKNKDIFKNDFYIR